MSKNPTAARVNARARGTSAADRAFLKRALNNPGLRHLLSPDLLPAKDRAARTLNTRLAQPITPGSTMTEGDLARSANAATAVAYGPQERSAAEAVGTAQQRARDIGGPGGFYDQYLASLAQNQKNVSDIQQGVTQGLQGVAQGVTGLGNQSYQAVQGQANADAAARGAQAGDYGQLANQAQAVRQALVGSFQAQNQLVGATRQNYASGLANVVAPTQKLAAQAQGVQQTAKAQREQAGVVADKAAANLKYREDTRAAERKNVIATATLTGTQANQLATRTEAHRHNVAGETAATARIDAAATQKQADRDAKAAAAAAKAQEPNKYGVPADQWAKWSTSHRQRVIDARGTSGGKPPDLKTQYDKDFYAHYHVAPASSDAIRRQQNNQGQAKSYLNTLLATKEIDDPNDTSTTPKKIKLSHDRHTMGTYLMQKYDPLTTSVILDLWQYKGKISAGTANRLHHAGYSVPQLGLATVPAPKSSPVGANTNAYGPSSAQPQGHY